MIIFEKWRGRLGNNITQLSNLIDIALFYKHNISFALKDDNDFGGTYFDLKIIEEYFNKFENDKIIKDDNDFFPPSFQPSFPKEVFNKDNKIKIDLLKRAFKIKDILKLNNDTVVVHIRSGDTFCRFPHPAYIPMPLDYYIKMLNKVNKKKIIIVSEDKINPVINKLMELYDNIIYTKNTLEEDIKIILGAQNVISSSGYFAKSLLTISDNIKNHYDITRYEKELVEYNLIMKPWRNAVKQRRYILSYNMDNSAELNKATTFRMLWHY
jgi:hypothetical protein